MSEHLNTATACLLWLSALAFIVYFAREYNWRRHQMGRSLMTMAVGLLAVGRFNLISVAFIPLFVGRASVWSSDA